MGQILRVDTAAIIAYDNLNHRSKSPPCKTDGSSRLCVIESIFHDIADCFDQSRLVADEGNFFIPGENERFFLLLCLIGKMPFNIAHYIRNILGLLFQCNGSCVQFGNFQKVLDKIFDPI